MSNLRNNQKSEANVKSNILAVTQKKLCLIDDQKKVCLTDTQKKLHSNTTQKITHNMSSLGSVELPSDLKCKKDILLYFKLRRKWKISEMNLVTQEDKDVIIKELEMINRYCANFLDRYSEVKIRISGVESKPFFYIGYNVNGETRYKYLSKKTNLNLIIIQANRKYISKLKNVISSEIAAMKNNRSFDISKKYNVYDDINPRLRKYIIPLLCSPQFAIDCWNNTIWKMNDYMEENKIYETNKGEKVRSKSEKMIADLLYTYTNIEYVYEGGVYLDSFQKFIYPDFVILNKNTGRVSFLEHAGMLDNSGYANDFVRKINEYAMEDYVIGKDWYITAETQLQKYNAVAVKKLIDYICK